MSRGVAQTWSSGQSRFYSLSKIAIPFPFGLRSQRAQGKQRARHHAGGIAAIFAGGPLEYARRIEFEFPWPRDTSAAVAESRARAAVPVF